MLTRAFTLLLLTAAPALAQSPGSEGILLLAHGGAADWNQRVHAVAATLNQTQPTEVALGMASRPSMQAAVDKLVARGVTAIVAVPMFVSSHSSVVTSSAYLLGVRADAPPDLQLFAKMNHGAHGDSHGDASHAAEPMVDNTRPLSSPVPIRMTEALNHHVLVGQILIDRARHISAAPDKEAVVLVAHGPVPEEENRRWLDDMKRLAEQVAGATSFAAVKYLTVRDDAPKATRDAATAELRQVVSEQLAGGRRVLIVPLLLSYGGIERGIRQRLEGLDFVMAEQALMPDDRVIEWVRQSVRR